MKYLQIPNWTKKSPVEDFYSSAIASISHRASFGKVLTATQERAGLEVKYFA